ncbi:MAG TPA: RnfABCDGE type electron transport complex subunit G [Clostridia bacterium]|nr:RnfABCDGE type electron transport complex subunit G [Clostridia bacterium]
MRDMIKPAVSLFIICLITAFCLAFVNNTTKDTIAQRIQKDAEEQRKQVLSSADSFKRLGAQEGEEYSTLIREAYAAYSGNKLVGYVFNAYPSGYGGKIAVTVGVGSDGKISGVKIGANQETPGLGSKTAEDGFTGQYIDKSIDSSIKVVKVPPKVDDEIQAVSGATISSRAVTNAVQASADMAKKLLQEQGGGESK